MVAEVASVVGSHDHRHARSGRRYDAANSLVGSHANDRVGDLRRVTALTNGNYLVLNPSWDNGTVKEAGAIGGGGSARYINGTSRLGSVSKRWCGRMKV